MVPSCLEGGLESEPHKGRTHSTAGRPLLPSYWSHPIPGGKSGGVWPPFGVRQSGRGLQLSGRGDGRGEITEGVLEPPRRRNPRAAAGGECLPAGSVVCGCSGVGGCVERRVFLGRLRAPGDCTRCGGDHESA